MSEFTDYYALLTEAKTLGVLRGALEQTVEGAFVPLDELPFEALDDPTKLEAAWANHPKPAWIKLGITQSNDIDDLAKLGPAVRIRVEEDFSAWALDVRCGGHGASIAILDTPDRYREATDMVPLYDAGKDFSALAGCLGVEDSALRATFIVDGGQAFAERLGIAYEQMLDMEILGVKVGWYHFGYLD